MPAVNDARKNGLEREEALRSKTPARIAQELWGLAIGYNLVRLAMARTAARLGVPPPPVKISSARTEWGSCTRAGVVRLNGRLVHLPPPLARYVVAHEVAHLAEMNHSPRFWARVETLYPGHAAARRALDDWTAVLEA